MSRESLAPPKDSDVLLIKKTSSFETFFENHIGLFLLLPIIIYFLVFLVYPVGQLVYLSFTNTKGVPSLTNLFSLATDPYLSSVAFNTIYYSVGSFAAEFALGFIVAFLLYFYRGRLSTFFRMSYSIPLMLSPVVSALLWLLIYNQNYGPLNYILSILHLGQVNWLGNSTYSMPALFIVNMWEYSPYVFILVFAALQTVPIQLHEAAAIDGMSRFQMFRYVLLPNIKGPVLIAALLNLIGVLKSFDLVYVLTYGGPGISTTVMSFYIYEEAFSFFQDHYAALLSLLYLIVMAIVVSAILKYTPIEREIGLKS